MPYLGGPLGGVTRTTVAASSDKLIFVFALPGRARGRGNKNDSDKWNVVFALPGRALGRGDKDDSGRHEAHDYQDHEYGDENACQHMDCNSGSLWLRRENILYILYE